jgi:hypothetical protein
MPPVRVGMWFTQGEGTMVFRVAAASLVSNSTRVRLINWEL